MSTESFPWEHHAGHRYPDVSGVRGHLERRQILGLIAATAVVSGCSARLPEQPERPTATGSSHPSPTSNPSPTVRPSPSDSPTDGGAPPDGLPSREEIAEGYSDVAAGEFGLEVPGTRLSLPEGCSASALTFDACGGASGSGVDDHLLETLRRLEVSATLFINRRWAEYNPVTMAMIVDEPLFDIQNHGTQHLPLSVTGKHAYGVPGTASPQDVYDEIMGNQDFLHQEYGVQCRFFRSGTAHLDEASAQICRDLGLKPVNFTVNLDDGATLSPDGVAARAAEISEGDIALGHFNQPASGTGEGLSQILPWLLEHAHRFVTLEQSC